MRCLRLVSTIGFALAVSVCASGLAVAAPLKFNFVFSSPTSAARAVGSITFESTLLPNPGNTEFTLPNPAVLDLRIVVTGASSGNGAFTLADFGSVRWETNGGTLDLSQQLVGQPTSDAPWGTTDGCAMSVPGTGGDFNLFGSAQGAPSGQWWFTLVASGGDCMVLTSMAPANGVAGIPTLSEWGLMTLCLLIGGVAAVSLRRRNQPA